VNDRSAGDPTLRLRDSEQESQTVIKVGADFYIHASSLTSRRATRKSIVTYVVEQFFYRTVKNPSRNL
jgi:hypothetical protein